MKRHKGNPIISGVTQTMVKRNMGFVLARLVIALILLALSGCTTRVITPAYKTLTSIFHNRMIRHTLKTPPRPPKRLRGNLPGCGGNMSSPAI